MTNQKWVIIPKEPLLNPRLRELFEYRYLLFQLVYRDIVASYKQTILGPAWVIIHPVITTLIFTLTFGKIIKVSTGGLPQPLFYLSGIICWNYFSECLNRTSTVFKDNINIFGKIYFPRIIVPISLSMSMFVRFIVHLFVLSAAITIYHDRPYHIQFLQSLILIPMLITMMALLGTGFGLIIACLTIKYKDLNFVISFGLQLTMYTTTVIFPLSSTPSNLRFLVQANPMTTIIETFRFAIFGAGNCSIGLIIYSITFACFVFLVGFFTFNRMERTFIDTI
jgi:lipopolysaccharide transport system permease protein